MTDRQLARWKPAARFPGDSLLLPESSGAPAFWCSQLGWETSIADGSSERISAAAVAAAVGPTLFCHVWENTARLLLSAAQGATQAAAGALEGNQMVELIEFETAHSLAGEMRDLCFMQAKPATEG